MTENIGNSWSCHRQYLSGEKKIEILPENFRADFNNFHYDWERICFWPDKDDVQEVKNIFILKNWADTRVPEFWKALENSIDPRNSRPIQKFTSLFLRLKKMLYLNLLLLSVIIHPLHIFHISVNAFQNFILIEWILVLCCTFYLLHIQLSTSYPKSSEIWTWKCSSKQKMNGTTIMILKINHSSLLDITLCIW